MPRGKKAVDVRRVVTQVLNDRIEHKEFAFSGSTSADFSTSGLVYPITQNVVQGDDIIQRSGDQIILERLTVSVNLINNTAALNSSFVGRVVVFSDDMSLSALPAVTDVLDTANYLSGYNNVNVQKRRFKILHDKMYDVVAETNRQSITFSIIKKLRHKVYYNGATNANSALGRGQVYILYIASAASATHFQYSSWFTLRYADP